MRIARFNIAGTDTLKKVQEKFSGLYPYLKINFYKSQNLHSGISDQGGIFYPDVKIKEINPQFSGGELIITDSMTVFALENAFRKLFDLSVQVLRKSGNLWLDTSGTNSWTLREQNDHGREISPEQKNKAVF